MPNFQSRSRGSDVQLKVLLPRCHQGVAAMVCLEVFVSTVADNPKDELKDKKLLDHHRAGRS